ncbi:serine hydrolase domain-containing protein [Tsukamurella soli]|uniref:Serine hydrolase n=1 Tax=Tsukamurella soli TaxID=644556 RepID=A0ABP8JE42_9ACTN
MTRAAGRPEGIDLSNWQEPQNVGWAFQHIPDLMPVAEIPGAGPAAAAALPAGPAVDLSIPVGRLGAGVDTAAAVLDDTHTDGFLVLHDGAVVAEQYRGTMTPGTRHLLMSVSKSLLGCVAGILREQGLIDPARAVTDYLPEVAGSGYAGATVRDVLDMRTGVRFSEAYTDPDAGVRVMERSAGWAPRTDADPAGLYDYITGLPAEGPHGGGFVYRSIDTDLLGWLCERVTGIRTAQLISELLWRPMGAEADAFVTVDALGNAMHDGGVCATLRDLARFGRLLCDDGVAGGRQVIPERWIAESFDPGADVRAAFAGTANEPVLPGGWYHNQFWFVRRGGAKVLLCMGIHGQLVYVHPGARTVAAKLSSWPDAQDTTALIDTLRACGSLAEALSSG